jgi:ParB family transcriptional regulator, chromosome partitioning protein
MHNVVLTNPFRCRMWDLHPRLEQHITEESCRTEIESFAKHGQKIAVLGRPMRGDVDCEVELIYGARRLFVARHLNVPLLVELREISDREAIVAMEIENQHRLDISPYERGLSYVRWLRSGLFSSQDDLAKALRISASQVSRVLKLARLPSVIVNAFESAREIREGWGTDLAEVLEDTHRRRITIDRARAISRHSPRPPASEVYRQLMSTSWVGRRLSAKPHDEVVTDSDGSPLFRIRFQSHMIALLFPINDMPPQTLAAIRDALRTLLAQLTAAENTVAQSTARHRPTSRIPDSVPKAQVGQRSG